MTPSSPLSTRFTYTTLFRSSTLWVQLVSQKRQEAMELFISNLHARLEKEGRVKMNKTEMDLLAGKRDRKSTRLNSSHVRISYAVFCLKKKKLCSHEK